MTTIVKHDMPIIRQNINVIKSNPTLQKLALDLPKQLKELMESIVQLEKRSTSVEYLVAIDLLMKKFNSFLLVKLLRLTVNLKRELLLLFLVNYLRKRIKIKNSGVLALT